jgi:hypothetical protein
MSAEADAKTILDVIEYAGAKAVALDHAERDRDAALQRVVELESDAATLAPALQAARDFIASTGSNTATVTPA